MYASVTPRVPTRSIVHFRHCFCGSWITHPSISRNVQQSRQEEIQREVRTLYRERVAFPSQLVSVLFVFRGRFQFLSSYDKSPWYEVTLEEFEKHALDRLRILAEIESSFARNRSWEELKTVTTRQLKEYTPLNSNSASTMDTQTERRNDHLGHFVLRLAFCRSCVTFPSLSSRMVTDF
jgi:hypothetical protein